MAQFTPSKNFLIRGGIVVGLVAVVLLFQTGLFHRIIQGFTEKNAAQKEQDSLTVGDVLSKDSNGEGIPDWEQELWGLNPKVAYTDGVSNAEIIKEREEALGVSDATPTDPSNETDTLAKELFTITTALSENGNVSDATLQNVADQLGSSVNVNSISNTYTLKNIHLVSTSIASLSKYYQNIVSIMGKTDLNDQDIPIIINAAQNGDYSQMSSLNKTGADYDTLAAQLSKISVPIGVAQYHLDLINSLTGMAASFTYLQQMQDNGIEGLIGVALYKTYNTRGSTALYNLQQYLTRYGILQQ